MQTLNRTTQQILARAETATYTTSKGDVVHSPFTDEEAADTVFEYPDDFNGFARSLARAHFRYGLSDKQRPWLHKVVLDFTDAAAPADRHLAAFVHEANESVAVVQPKHPHPGCADALAEDRELRARNGGHTPRRPHAEAVAASNYRARAKNAADLRVLAMAKGMPTSDAELVAAADRVERKAAFAERERKQEEAGFASDPDYRRAMIESGEGDPLDAFLDSDNISW